MTCACPNCSCSVSEENKIEKDGKIYCCKECAEGHPNKKGCCNGSCQCG